MKKNIKHISNLIIVAVVIFGLAVTLPMSAMSAWFSATAQTAKGEDAIPSLKEQKLDDSLQDAVADTRYEARWEDRPARGMLAPAYHASNPAQQYDSYFTPNGLTLTPQDAPNDDMPKWRVGMRLIGYGYGENLLNVGTAAMDVQAPELSTAGPGCRLPSGMSTRPGGWSKASPSTLRREQAQIASGCGWR